MAKGEYRGVANVARKVTKEYRGVSNVARKVVKAYRGVANVARQYFGGYSTKFIETAATSSEVTNCTVTADNLGETWYFECVATISSTISSGNPTACVEIYGSDWEGLELTMTYSASSKVTSSSRFVHFLDSSGEVLDSKELAGSTSYSATIPSGTATIRIGVETRASGTRTYKLTVTDLYIGDEQLV